MSFWDGMELWEKMLLVLAAGMACTLIYAISKLIYGNRKVKRHTMLAEARKTHLETVRSSRHVIELKGDDVPFGVKALESGIEVEGIVISRSVTPDSRRSQQTLVGSDNESLSRGQVSPGQGVAQSQQMRQTGRPLVYQPSPYIALPAPSHRGNSGSSSLRSSAASVVSTPSGVGSNDAPIFIGRRSLSDPILQSYGPVSPASRSGSSTPKSHREHIVDPIALARLEGRFLPLPSQKGHRRKKSYTSHSPSHPSSRSQSRTPTPPDGQRTPSTLPSVHEDSTGESSRESDSSIESDGIERPRRPGLIASYSSPVVPSAPIACRYVPETAYGDLSLLHIHRLSHAAEVGQLLPRNSRTSRVLSGTGIINRTSPHSFASPTMVHPVYAFDITLPPAVPTAAVLRAENPEPPFPEPTKPYIQQSFQSDDASRFVEELWSQSILSAEPQLDGSHEVNSPPTHPKPEGKKKAPNRLRKKRVSKARSSMDVDLEAQD